VVEVKCPDEEPCYGEYGEMVDLPVTQDPTDLIHAHIMPGKFLAFQSNKEEKFSLTSDILKQPVTMIANRDHNKHAEGRLFLDDGISVDQLEQQAYEHYEFQLSANSIKKWIQNENSNSVDQGIKIDKFVIADASDLKETDFACLNNGDMYNLVTLPFAYDDDTMTLSIDMSAQTPFNMRDIYFGNSKTDLNLCEPYSTTNYYHTKDNAAIDLTKSQVEVELVSTNPVLKNLALKMAVLENGSVNIELNYADEKDASRKFFTVPTDLVDTGKDKLAEEPLSTYVTATQVEGQPLALAVLNKAGQVIYQVDGIVLSEYHQQVGSTLKVSKTSKGVMGLFERTSLDLYLPDGVYSLWSRDIPNPIEDGKAPGKNLYGTHPVVFATATDSSWFGVYSNLAAA